MKTCFPEDIGLSSAHVLAFYKELEEKGLSTHSVVMARGDYIFSECYYAPFHKDFLHRMYSVSKSFVSVAIGFCEQDGLLSLDDPISKYFPEYRSKLPEEAQTVREMLKMETAVENGIYWFKAGCSNRTELYFDSSFSKLSGTLFDYDSFGSYILCALVERVTGKTLLDYLREKVLDRIGFSKEAYFLKVPGGNSFGDSGLMCSARDLLLMARFVLNMGSWEGVSYLNSEYLKLATIPSVCNNDYGFTTAESCGYGYQFWGAPEGCYMMLGMGGQIALCDPKHDFVFVINSDNQGHPFPYEGIMDALYRHVIRRFDGNDLQADPLSQRRLIEYTSSQKLFSLPEGTKNDFQHKISGKTFICGENRMGIRYFRLIFGEDCVEMQYENAQGEKSFTCGLGYNAFGLFPQEGYSDEIATVPCRGHRYKAAFSADWPEEKKLRMRVQIIDKYFGNLSIIFGFRDENSVTVRMRKSAEAFLEEYSGTVNAVAESETV